MTLFSFAETGYSRRRARRGDLRLYKQMLGGEPPQPPNMTELFWRKDG